MQTLTRPAVRLSCHQNQERGSGRDQNFSAHVQLKWCSCILAIQSRSNAEKLSHGIDSIQGDLVMKVGTTTNDTYGMVGFFPHYVYFCESNSAFQCLVMTKRCTHLWQGWQWCCSFSESDRSFQACNMVYGMDIHESIAYVQNLEQIFESLNS